MKFKRPDPRMPNQVIFFEDTNKYYFVSYNPTTNHGKPETAIRAMNGYYILNGDLRKEIEKCKTFDEAFEIFKNSKLEISGYSSNINNI